jgi:predicted small secreted protein
MGISSTSAVLSEPVTGMRTKRCSTLLILALALALAGCNTVKGMGKDLQRAGQKIEDATKK